MNPPAPPEPKGSHQLRTRLGSVAAISAVAVVVVCVGGVALTPGAAFALVPIAVLWAVVAVGDRTLNASAVAVGAVAAPLCAVGAVGVVIASQTSHRPSMVPFGVAGAVAATIATGVHVALVWVSRPARSPDDVDDGRDPLVRASANVCQWACYATALLWAVFGIASFFFALVIVPLAVAWAFAGRSVARGSRPAAVVVTIASGLLLWYWAASTINPPEQYNDPAPAVVVAFVVASALALVTGVSALPQALPVSLVRRIGSRR